ncbi:MAG TPA: alpha/beta hydrolase, partial [Acidimicrobiia bacterium]|nr:alpha/beta hydrolase [Acidimicrobiia bacterium]
MTSTEDVRAVDLVGRDGLRLRADEFGDADGPTVVLLHGGGQTRYAWGSTARVLAERGWHVYRVDLRGHGDSDWPDDGDYGPEAFAGDVYEIATAMPEPPVLVGASLGGIASMVAIGTHEEPVARALVLVDVAPKIEESGAMRIGAFMSEHMEDGFGSLEEVADAVAAYNPHRPRPTDLSGLKKNVRQREDGRWVWHWDPRFMQGKLGSRDETRASLVHEGRLQDAAQHIKVPTLL